MKKNLRFNLIYFLVFLFPILPQYIYVASGINIVNMVLILFAFFWLTQKKSLKIYKVYSYIKFFWIYYFLYAIRMLFDGEVISCIGFVISYIWIPYILITYINSKEKFSNIIWILIYSGVLLGIIGLIEEITHVNFFQIFSSTNIRFLKEVRYGVYRIAGTFSSPITYGMYCFFILALINYKLSFSNNNKTTKMFLVIAYILLIINLLFTMSRISIISFILFQLLFIIETKKIKNNKVIFIIVSLFIIISILLLNSYIRIPFVSDILNIVYSRMGINTSTEITETAGNRFELKKWVMEEVGDDLLYGKGTKIQFQYKVIEGFVKTSIENQYLYTLYHIGIIGLIIMILYYISVLVFSFQNGNTYIDKNVETVSFSKMCFYMFFVYYIASIGVQETDIKRLVVLFISLLISYININGKSNKIETKNNEEKE